MPFKPPGVVRASVVRAAQATVSHVSVRVGVDSGELSGAALAHAAQAAVSRVIAMVGIDAGALRALVIAHEAGSEFIPPVPKFNLADVVVVLDVSFIAYDQRLADDVLVTDELGFEAGIVFTDSASTLDAVEKDFTKAAADTVGAIDVVTTLLTKGLNVADSVTVIDVATALLGGKPELNEMELNTVELN